MKKETHFFTTSEYRREADYLRQMHLSGWKLVKVSFSLSLIGAVYTFEETDLADVTYVVFSTRSCNSKRQINPSWERVSECRQTIYLCKPTHLVADRELEALLPSSKQVQQLISSQFLPYGIILIAILLPKWLRGQLFTVWWSSGLFMLLNLLYLCVLGRSLYYMMRLSRRQRDEKNSL